jgi:hypothetical protein
MGLLKELSPSRERSPWFPLLLISHAKEIDCVWCCLCLKSTSDWSLINNHWIELFYEFWLVSKQPLVSHLQFGCRGLIVHKSQLADFIWKQSWQLKAWITQRQICKKIQRVGEQTLARGWWSLARYPKISLCFGWRFREMIKLQSLHNYLTTPRYIGYDSHA